ncbi:acetyl-CoA carboxylase [Angomonas deanei]|nr:acetyl-CoA carboxylase [Angomonas deanei]|eukprot:EPY33533.1 acetyl-CoA carboxylase [Angomonas deanei]
MKVSDSRGFHFDSLKSLCDELGAKTVIKRLLIANNGLAAVKGIDSIRSWLYEHTGDPEAVQFVVMATPEDLKANAEFISLADHHVPVPGGPNGNNYANVDLIMHTALQNTCDAIYPGWGHASENPALPRECNKSKRVVFLGPSEEAMFALGDKIASTIVAQSNGVPTVPWSGDSIRLPVGCFDVDAVTYDKAYVTSPEECEDVCRRIGFPVMIKASEGGGGKGIRCCTSASDVKDMYFAVSEEVKGCHIFVMRMLTNVRHLEVQLLADSYQNCIAVRTRDCSVQRRHQKIIEEGPAFGVDPAIITEMEKAAIRLAKAVKYRGLGTVEYMYDKETHEFYFLELNPRIQVEHPVSELISGVNLPAALYCVGMGIPLHRIPEVRTFYGENPYDTSPIDFETRQSLPAKGHTIAVRVTAEDTDEGFRPTSGKVDEISFKNSKECWGYFSVGSGGEIHQFADSQFGHIFSSGETREEARRGMVLALRNLVIRGEIRTSSAYVLDLLETPAFRDCDVSTAWLDHRIAKHAEEVPTQRSVHNALIAACIYRGLRSLKEDSDKYISFLSAGHVPSTDYLINDHVESYVSRGEKYTVRAGKISPSEYAISLNGSIIIVPYRILKSGAIQLSIGSKTIVAYVAEEPNSLRITIGGKVTNFTGDLDPTKILAAVPGRLVRYVIENDGHVNEGGTFAEIEVMKMILPLRASTTGILHHRAVPGSTVAMGSLLGEITPDDPSKVARPFDVKESWPGDLLIEKKFERPDGATRARRALEALWNMLSGYHFKEISVEERVRSSLEDLSSLFLSSVSLSSLMVPFLADVATDDVPQTPNDKLKTVFSVLIERYLSVERAFDDRTRQEAIDILRNEFDDDKVIYDMDFAHNQECHHAIIKGILSYLEHNNVLLKSMQEPLSLLVELQSYAYGTLLLQTRFLLRQCTLPSFTERKSEFAKRLEEGSISEILSESYGYDLLCSVMFDRQLSHLTQICLEYFIRNERRDVFEIKDLDIYRTSGSWVATYTVESIEDVLAVDDKNTESHKRIENGFCLVFPEEQLRNSLASVFKEVLVMSSREASTCTVFFSTVRDASQEDVSQMCRRVLEENNDSLLHHGGMKTVYFIVHGMVDGPHIFTFRKSIDYQEDTLIRNVLPQNARRLELDRLSNFDVAMYPTPFKEVHVFKGTPKKQGASHLENRLFARVSVTANDMGMSPWTEATDVDAGHMLAKCVAALEVARDDIKLKYPPSNHVFIKMIDLTFDLADLKRLLLAAASSYQQRLLSLGVNEVEIAFQVRIPEGVIPMRVIVDSPSGFGISAHVFYESVQDGETYLHRAENSEDVAASTRGMSSESLVDLASPTLKGTLQRRTYSKLEALRDMLPSKGDNISFMGENASSETLSGATLLGPYPQLNKAQVKRLQAKAANTTYAEDWPALLQLIVKKDWSTMRRLKQVQGKEGPKQFLKHTQLYITEDGERLTNQKRRRHPCLACWCG